MLRPPLANGLGAIVLFLCAAASAAAQDMPKNADYRYVPLEVPRLVRQKTWHAGAGIELVTIKSYSAPPRGLDFSVRGDWTVYSHNLGLDVGLLPLETLVLLGRTASDLPAGPPGHPA